MSDTIFIANTAELRSSVPRAAASSAKLHVYQRSKSGGVLLAACKNVRERGHCRSCINEQQTPSAERHADSSESHQGETLQNVKPVQASGGLWCSEVVSDCHTFTGCWFVYPFTIQVRICMTLQSRWYKESTYTIHLAPDFRPRSGVLKNNFMIYLFDARW
jgi:hypothetical protein